MTSSKIFDNLINVRSLKNWKNVNNYIHDGVKNFKLNSSNANGIHTIVEGGLPIDIKIKLRRGCPLVIFLNGAQQRDESKKLPVFAGFGVLPPANISHVSINDPSLYVSPTLRLAWYGGSKDLPLQLIMPKIINLIIKIAAPSKIIFSGGSGGGFASLYYSRLVSGSLAVIWNPQTNILKYQESHVAHYSLVAFGIADMKTAKLELPNIIDVDLGELYKGGSDNYILYMQNSSDSHVVKHCKPFLEKIGHELGDEVVSRRVNSRLYLHMDTWGEGHVQPPKYFLKALLKKLLDSECNWGQLIDGEMGDILKESMNELEIDK